MNQQENSLIILDVNLPDGNGFSLSRKIREKSRVPIIFLTANDLDEDMKEGFEAGADDYITKPFNIKVLLQRIAAILRRCEAAGEQELTCGNLRVNIKSQTVKKKGENLMLTPTEWKLLLKFLSNQGQVLTRQILLDALGSSCGFVLMRQSMT